MLNELMTKHSIPEIWLNLSEHVEIFFYPGLLAR